jgi:hypothetical protein
MSLTPSTSSSLAKPPFDSDPTKTPVKSKKRSRPLSDSDSDVDVDVQLMEAVMGRPSGKPTKKTNG